MERAPDLLCFAWIRQVYISGFLFLHQPNPRFINICKMTEIVAAIPEYSFHKHSIPG